MRPERVIRLALDINVLFADHRARDKRLRGTAASMLVDAVRDGTCPAGPVQLITSVPVVENWADVMRREFGYDAHGAREKADVLLTYAAEGPVPDGPRIVVGAGHLPFGTEEQIRKAVLQHSEPENADKLFNEIEDDRHVQLAALAGEADILATSDDDLFTKPRNLMVFERDDVVILLWGGRRLIIAKPSFVAHWLRVGFIPDADFVVSRPDEFRPRTLVTSGPRQR